MTFNEGEHYFSENPQSKTNLSLITAHLRGRKFEFFTSSSVFSKKRIDPGTRLLIESMILPKKGVVLDIGCGYGAVGIAVATFNPELQVFLTDINNRAVVLAKQNAEKNKVKNVKVKQGNLYDPVGDQIFDCVLSNPPISAGMDIVQAIIQKALARMSNNASLQMVVRSKVGKKLLPPIFENTFGNVTVLSIESGYRVLMAVKS